MGKLKILGVIVSLSCLLVSTSSSMAETTFEIEPSGLESFKQKIANSLVGVTCTNTTIGYAEDVQITEENKNNGDNTYIVTSYRALLPCIQNRNLKVTVTYKGKTYNAKVWSWSANPEDDLASVMTTVLVPVVKDWSSYRPEKNWWLLFVQWGEGALLADPKVPEPVFSTTRIFAVRNTEFTFSVSPRPFPIGLMKYGIFFDNEGKLVGTIRWKYDDEPASVTGFPRICSVAGGSTADRSLLNCGSSRQEYWGKTVPTPTPTPTASRTPTPTPTPLPTPTPSISATDSSEEGTDAYNAAMDAYNLFKEARKSCLSAFRGNNVAERNVLSIVNGTKICANQDVQVEDNYKRLLTLRSSAISPSVTVRTINAINAIASAIENSTGVIDEGTVMGEELLSMADNLALVQAYLSQFTSSDKRIMRVLASLPKSLRNIVTQSITYQEYGQVVYLISEIESSLKVYLKDLAALSSSNDPYYAITEGINELADSVGEIGDINTDIQRVLNSIPTFYCKKSTSFEFPSNGKCKAGFTKIPTKK